MQPISTVCPPNHARSAAEIPKLPALFPNCRHCRLNWPEKGEYDYLSTNNDGCRVIAVSGHNIFLCSFYNSVPLILLHGAQQSKAIEPDPPLAPLHIGPCPCRHLVLTCARDWGVPYSLLCPHRLVTIRYGRLDQLSWITWWPKQCLT